MLGDSYQTVARRGLSFQRSQTSGSFSARPGPSVSYYKRLQTLVEAPARETSFFDGIDTTLPGAYRALRKTAPATADAWLLAIDREIKDATQAFTMTDPSAAVPALGRALAATRTAATALAADADVVDLLRVKAKQIEEAIGASLGIAFTAVAPNPRRPRSSPARPFPSRPCSRIAAGSP